MNSKHLKDLCGFSLILLFLGSGFLVGDYISARNLKIEKKQWIAQRLAYQSILGVKPGAYLERVISRQDKGSLNGASIKSEKEKISEGAFKEKLLNLKVKTEGPTQHYESDIKNHLKISLPNYAAGAREKNTCEKITDLIMSAKSQIGF